MCRTYLVVLLLGLYLAPVAHLVYTSSLLQNKYVSFDPWRGEMRHYNATLFEEELKSSCSRLEQRLQKEVVSLRAEFESKGYLVLRQVLPVEVVDALNINRPKVYTSIIFYPIERLLVFTVDYLLNTDFQFSSIDSLWVDDPLLLSFWYNGCVPQIVGEIAMASLGERQDKAKDTVLTYPTTKLLVDFYIGFPQGIRPQVIGDWHTDTTSFDIVDRASTGISAWMPLVDIEPDTQGASIYLASKEKYRDHAACQKDLVTPNKECINFLDSIRECHSWKRGDLLLFAKDTFHRSQPSNPNGGLPERWSFVGRFISRDATFVPPEGEFATHKKNTCRHGLRRGDAVVTPCFPVLYPATNETEVKVRMEGGLGHLSNSGMVLSQIKGLFS